MQAPTRESRAGRDARRSPLAQGETPVGAHPIPIRFPSDDELLLRQLKALTGISVSNIIRRACRYAAPRFLDGRINLLTLQDERNGTPLNGKFEIGNLKSET